MRGLLAGLLGGVAVFAALLWYVDSVQLPPDQLPVQTTYITDVHGERLASLNGGEDRQVIPLAKIPAVLRAAVIAAEDRRFYRHGGVDPFGIVRALLTDVRTGDAAQGGSTITQQYVKNVYVGRQDTIRRKLREAAIAIKLEKRLSKDEILERYLNTIYFGRGAYGVQAAARAYFGKDVGRLDLPQAAYLAALIRGPESTDAVENLPKATRRRASVLQAMVETGAITEAQRATADRTPMIGGADGVLAKKPVGSAYAHPEAGTEYFVDYVRKVLVDQFGQQALLTAGLRVKTTLDLSLQQKAFDSTYAEVLSRDGDPDAAVVVLDHRGRVKAMVGGRDWATSQVNLAVGTAGGGRGRPAGSTFKTFVLSSVVHAGYSVESAVSAPAQIRIPGVNNGQDWVVSNYDAKGYGTINLIDATRLSINTVYAQLVTDPEIGALKVKGMAEAMGIRSDLSAVPSIALGTQDVAPIDMADAYLTLANRGMHIDPSVLVEVRDAQGNKWELDAPSERRVLSTDEADTINEVLQRVVQGGTGTGAQVPGVRIAGKTGTTQNYNDAWFVGFSPKECCSVAVWMGYRDGARPMNDVHGRRVSGGSFPADVFRKVMTAATDGLDTGTFEKGDLSRGEPLTGRRAGMMTKKRTIPTDSTIADTSVVPVSEPAVSVVEGVPLPGTPSVPATPPSTAPRSTVAPVPVGGRTANSVSSP